MSVSSFERDQWIKVTLEFEGMPITVESIDALKVGEIVVWLLQHFQPTSLAAGDASKQPDAPREHKGTYKPDNPAEQP
jgi:hypothetical protein